MSDIAALSDAQLLARLADGEQPELVWRLLVQRHRLRVLARAKEIIEDWDLARDLAQETFLRLHEAIIDQKTISHLPTYLYRVCTNLSISQLREGERKSRLKEEFAEYLEKSAAAIVNNEAILRLSNEDYGEEQRLQQAMLQLQEVQQRALRLFYHQRLSYQLIAAELDISVGEVRSALQNGKAKLRRLLQKPSSKEVGEGTV